MVLFWNNQGSDDPVSPPVSTCPADWRGVESTKRKSRKRSVFHAAPAVVTDAQWLRAKMATHTHTCYTTTNPVHRCAVHSWPVVCFDSEFSCKTRM